jgi:ketosteroid isomerase-like protein
MENSRARQTALAFIDRINAGDPEGIAARMTEDHVFIDSLGNRMQGRDAMHDAWVGYLSWFPDYRIEVDMVIEEDDLVALFGTASATFAVDGVLSPANGWNIPAAWTARVDGDRIAEWRVYADNTPVAQIMERAGG